MVEFKAVENYRKMLEEYREELKQAWNIGDEVKAVRINKLIQQIEIIIS